MTPETKLKISTTMKGNSNAKGSIRSPEWRANHSKVMQGRKLNMTPEGHLSHQKNALARLNTPESLQKRLGRRYVTDGTNTKSIPAGAVVPDGWVYGDNRAKRKILLQTVPNIVDSTAI